MNNLTGKHLRLMGLTAITALSFVWYGCSSSESAVQSDSGGKEDKVIKEEKVVKEDKDEKEVKKDKTEKSTAKKEKKEKEVKFEKTGTSADGFLKAAFDLHKNMKDFNKSYEDTKMYIHLLLSNPSELIGKDVAAAVGAARDAGSVPANLQISDLNGLFDSKKDALKDLKDAAIKNSVTEMITSIKTMITSLGAVPGDAVKLVNEGKELPDKLKAEMTGMKAAKLPGVVKKVADSSTKLTGCSEEAPKMVTNLTEIAVLLDKIVKLM
jgi:hypothetical protein